MQYVVGSILVLGEILFVAVISRVVKNQVLSLNIAVPWLIMMSALVTWMLIVVFRPAI